MPKQLSADIDLHGRKRVRPTTTANDKLALIAYALHSVVKMFLKPVWEGNRVSVQGVESLWGDCRFILADWGS